MPIRFKARIRDDGEVVIELRAFRITAKSRFIRQAWHAKVRSVAEFTLLGVAQDGLRFESDSLSFNALGERWSGVHGRHWSKPRGEVGEARVIRPLEAPAGRTFLRLRLKGFECYPALRADTSVGRIQVGGETSLGKADRLTGVIVIEPKDPPSDLARWRIDAEKLLEHVRRIFSLGSGTMLQAPILEFVHGSEHRIETLSQSEQSPPVLRVFHKLGLQPVLDAAVASFSHPPVDAKNLFFAIEWLAMASSYNEVRLVSAMTALENLVDSNLAEDEASILPRREFEKTRRTLRKVIADCLERWPPEHADGAREELGEKLLDLNRRPFKRKLRLLAARWQVPLDGITDGQIGQAIRARNLIVHTGHFPRIPERAGKASGEKPETEKADSSVPDLWDHMTVVRELVVRFLLTAIGYSGTYITHLGGYHLVQFPPLADDDGERKEKAESQEPISS